MKKTCYKKKSRKFKKIQEKYDKQKYCPQKIIKIKIKSKSNQEGKNKKIDFD